MNIEEQIEVIETSSALYTNIVEFLNTGDSGGEQHEKEDNSCSTN